jgi:hypothetical protein
VVESQPSKLLVAGSIPVSRSIVLCSIRLSGQQPGWSSRIAWQESSFEHHEHRGQH